VFAVVEIVDIDKSLFLLEKVDSLAQTDKLEQTIATDAVLVNAIQRAS
jgi:hypothetical protein